MTPPASSAVTLPHDRPRLMKEIDCQGIMFESFPENKPYGWISNAKDGPFYHKQQI
jgi:hypothetical protein